MVWGVLLVALFASHPAQAQSCSIPGQAGTDAIATQPNTFFPGTASPGAGNSSIAVGAGTGLSRDIQAGDLLLIIQMQGADFDASDTNAYGSGTGAAGVTSTVAFGAAGYAGGINGSNFIAGTYEWAVATNAVGFAAGGTINLSRGLSNGYFTRAGSATTGKQAFQVIRVPQYANATVTAGLTVQAWNGGTGGVLAIDAAGDINLNGQTIDGNGRGFRGAGGVNVTPQCIATPDPIGCLEFRGLLAGTRGGSKGEGLAGTPGRVYDGDPGGTGGGTIGTGADGYVNGDLMRGAPGNAGGGGNQHNAGGGGGANGGAGGNGGNSWNNSQVTYVGTLVGGFGGSPSQNAAARWVMGGGGGAADLGGNGTTAPDGSGGAAGAMVILRASRLVGGGTISLNGVRGQNSRATDGAGGGGAGGTLILALGSGGVAGGAINASANGGAGGAYTLVTAEQDGNGGGGGGGMLVHNIVSGSVSFVANGGAAIASNSQACPPATPGADCGQRSGLGSSGAAGYAITSPGVQVGYECLPNLTVTKSTTTPTVTAATGATAQYVITISNAGGGARFVDVVDNALPPGWSRAAAAPTYQFSPPQPLAADQLSSGAETVSLTTSATWAVGAAPLAAGIPTAGSNSLTWSSFALAPVKAGVPSVVTITFVASIPDTATVGTYHNPAGVRFLDPTRAAGSTRTVAPSTNNTANRSATPYSPNTTYMNFAGAGGTPVAGTHYSGLQAGPSTEDVRLLPDFSITKAASVATVAPGVTFTYTLTPRNNGRPVSPITFAIDQATDLATVAAVGAALASSPLTVTDSLPTGVTTTAAFNGAGWTCSGTSTVACTLPDAQAFQIASATNYPVITATVRISDSCPSSTKTNAVSITLPTADTAPGNNSATAVVAPSCLDTSLTVTKTNGVNTLTAGGTTSYTITVANLGPSNAPGTTVLDPPASGLACGTPTCAATAGASCPAPLNTFQTTGVTITPTFNAGSTVTFVLTCNVTATGQ